MTVDDYIAAAPSEARPILKDIRQLAAILCPAAKEAISYGMPALKQGKTFLYFGAFKGHIGIYPPVSGPASLVKRLDRFRGPKGNLQFRYEHGVPLELVGEVITALHKSYSLKK